MRRVLVIMLMGLAACGGSEDGGAAGGGTPLSANAADVRACLERSAPAGKWAEIQASDFGGTVYGIDFDSNSVQIYVEPDSQAALRERDSIRAAEAQLGQTAPPHSVIIRTSGNVLVSWSSEPTPDQLSLVRGCAGLG